MTGPSSEQDLDALARRHGTDKHTSHHRFTPIYEELLRGRREMPMKLLEIGIYKGASLRMWKDYLPACQIVGVDVDPVAMAHEDERIKVYIGDQANRGFLEQIAQSEGPFDFVVDDGGHRAVQQKTSLRALWSHVKPGGIYVIEDIHTSYYQGQGFDMGWREPDTTVEFLKYVVDDIHVRYHEQPVTLADLESIQFYPEICVMRRAYRP